MLKILFIIFTFPAFSLAALIEGTSPVTSSSSSVSGSAILNQNTLQSGSTFYVSSGTVDGQFISSRSSGFTAVGRGNYGEFFSTTPKFTVWTSSFTNALELDIDNDFAAGDLSGNGPNPTSLTIDQTAGFNLIKGSTSVFYTDANGNIGIGGTGVGLTSPLNFSVPNGFVFFGNVDGTVQLGDLSSFSSGVELEVNQLQGAIVSQSTNGLRMSSGTGFTALRSSSTSTNITFTLPASSGTTGQVLTTNGAGNMYWATPSGGALTYLYVKDVSTINVNSGVATRIIFTNVVEDTASGYNASTGTYTVPSSGIYEVHAYASSPDAVQGNAFGTLLYKNGALYLDMGLYRYSNAGAIYQPMGGSGLVRCIAGDVITVYFVQNTGGGLNLADNVGETFLQIVKLGT